MNLLFKLGLAVAATISATEAKALSLSPISFNSYASAGYCTTDCSNPSKTVYGLNSAISTPSSYGSNQTILSDAPSIKSYAEADLFNGDLNANQFVSEGTGYAQLIYDFEIIGPTTMPIPVLVQASGAVQATGGTYASVVSGIGAQSDAYFYLVQAGDYEHPNIPIITKHEFASYGVGSSGGVKNAGFNVNDTISLTSNTLYQVQMTVKSVASLDVFNGVTAIDDLTTQAEIDPTFTVDAADSKDYSIVFSQGLGGNPVSAVPIPASLPLLGSALLILGAASYGLNRARPNART